MGNKVVSGILGALLVTYFVVSLFVLALGIWLRNYESHHTILFGEQVIHRTSLLLIIMGSFFIVTALCGCFCTCCSSMSRCGQILFSSLLLLALVTLIVSGSIFAHMRTTVSSSLEKVVSDNLKEHYGFKPEFTSAVDGLQIEDECCGINDPLIYQSSKWYAMAVRTRKGTVPDSCCVRNPNGTFWNLNKCHETVYSEAQIAIYQKGCYTSIRATVDHLLYGANVAIFTIATIMGLIAIVTIIMGLI